MSNVGGTRRRIKLATVAGLVVAGLLAGPVAGAHAINMGALVGNPGDVFNGPGRTCGNQNEPGVYLYSDNTYRGKCAYWELGNVSYNEDSIRAVVGNDKASSMRVVGGGEYTLVWLYKHNSWRVRSVQPFRAGNIPDFKAFKFEDGSSLNDNVSSLRITG
ncbi:MAG TPA: hypothetical protein PKE40_13450 [Arachnia sp.]|nr:hypothetical protein [Arachnia sp.]HMT87350.1 hypothetical protein [Arachnia sp.]